MKKHKSNFLPLIVSCIFLANIAVTAFAQTATTVADGGSFSAANVPAAITDGSIIALDGSTATGDVKITLPSNITINTPSAGSTITVSSSPLFSNSAAGSYNVNVTGGDLTFTGGNANSGSVFYLSAAGSVLTINTDGGALNLVNNTGGNTVTAHGGAISVGIGNNNSPSTKPGTGDLIINGVLNATGNQAYYGGAIYTGGALTAGVEGLTSTLTGNISSSADAGSGGGGAIYSLGNVTLHGDWVINGNKALVNRSLGGAIYSGGNVLITGILNADGNHADYGGGVIQGGNITAGVEGKTSALTNNTAGTSVGGAFAGGTIMLYGDWIITGNTSVGVDARNANSGGAISASGDLTITGNVTLDNNAATVTGGAISSNRTVTLGKSGGASSLSGNTLAVVLVPNSSGSPTSSQGGGIYSAGYGANGNVTLNGDWTIDNNAAMFGGAIYTYGSVAINGNVTADGNKAPGESTSDGYGGMIYAYGAVTMSGSVSLTNNEANYGGAIMSGYTGGDITLGAAGAASYITGNSALLGSGGAIYAYNNVMLNGDWTIDSNTAAANGGAIRSAGNVTIGAADSTLTIANNTSKGTASGGGAVYAAGNVTINGTLTADNNTASGSYGGFIQSNANVNITGDSVITDNTGTNGGAIIALGAASVVTIGAADTTLTLSNNTATTGSGGAIYSAKDAALTGSLTIDNNKAATSGGALLIVGNTTMTGDANVTNNTAGGRGGAIRSGGNLTLNATSGSFIFSGNTDSAGPNAIYLVNTGSATVTALNAASADIIFYDPIASNGANGLVTVNKTGANMVSFDGIKLGAGNNSAVYANTTVEEGIFEISNNAIYGALASDDAAGTALATSFTAQPGTTVYGGLYGTLRADTVVLDGATLNIAGRQAFATSGHYNKFVIDPATLSMNGTSVLFNT